ncbi:hypothetical protein F5887DRAFT_984584 [Amanita rubescens]|nr:hypothetical protein F5887DRAFT_984584 [Amanita rubescens]
MSRPPLTLADEYFEGCLLTWYKGPLSTGIERNNSLFWSESIPFAKASFLWRLPLIGSPTDTEASLETRRPGCHRPNGNGDSILPFDYALPEPVKTRASSCRIFPMFAQRYPLDPVTILKMRMSETNLPFAAFIPFDQVPWLLLTMPSEIVAVNATEIIDCIRRSARAV